MSELAFNRVILQNHNKTLSILVTSSLVANLLLGIALLFQVNRKPILVASASEGFEVLEQTTIKLDEQMLTDFTVMISTQYLNFNSLTLPKQIEAIAKYLDVQPVESILNTYKKNEERMLKDQVSHDFVMQKIEITKKNSPFWVELKGNRTIYARGNKKSLPVVYLFEIKKVRPDKTNPYGLIVTRVIEKNIEQPESAS